MYHLFINIICMYVCMHIHRCDICMDVIYACMYDVMRREMRLLYGLYLLLIHPEPYSGSPIRWLVMKRRWMEGRIDKKDG